ncbi:aminotransferase class I/II-fold pyridoxal phosphate-dependent enzyme [Jannaschia sp. KMU-145]|uniref:aminotransferase class I/II-fold pyridoxal phosphate-dependent enzyme n=1 Tax=Jannaschia halovivens TaxID=3388667 RepID=UPI00396AF2B2
MSAPRDHGGGLDAARSRWGGARDDWIDLSTGINPVPYPVPPLARDAWTALPDAAAATALTEAARRFWDVPDGAEILAAPGASALIARMPALVPGGRVRIPGPTYNEHAAAFRAHGFEIGGPDGPMVVVHPNNPDGRLWGERDLPNAVTIIDESFCDVCPEVSHVARAARPGTVVLKSFGKFCGLAGLRLGFAIGTPDTIAPLAEALGPWPVSGPALAIGAAALADTGWADATRARLAADAARLDALLAPHGDPVGGTTLFRLYDTPDAAALRDRLAEHRIWSRVFPYSDRWVRLGMPPASGWDRLEAALA